MENNSSRRSASSYTDDDDHSYISRPWFIINSLEQVAEALLRCLGFRSPADETTPTITSNHHRQTPQSIPTKKEVEDGGVVKSTSSRSIAGAPTPRAAAAAVLRLNNRKPPKPPVSSGKGGKTNYSAN